MTDLPTAHRAICTVCHIATADVRRYRVQRESAVRACRLLALCAQCREPVEALLGVPAAARRLPATAGGLRPPLVPSAQGALPEASGVVEAGAAPAGRAGRHLRLVPS